MIRRPRWQGSVLSKRGRLYLQVKDEAGAWRQRGTGLLDTPEGHAAAEAMLSEIRIAIHATEEAAGGEVGALTVERWVRTWLRRRDVADVENDRIRLALHVLPVIGAMRLEDVRPRHLVEVVERLRRAERAPRTIRNVYSVTKALFRDARIADVCESDPCILTHRQLGRIRDAKPGWRDSAVYGRAELVALLSDPRIPEDRRVSYGVLGLAGLRTGEMAGLRWASVQAGEPLGRLVVSTSYDRGRTKTGEERWAPIHPTLAAMLAEWRLAGWARVFDRAPVPADLVLPVPPARNRGPRRKVGALRTKKWVWWRLQHDLQVLGLRARRVHDLRRSFISLAVSDGADERLLRRGTHAAPRHVMGLYLSPEWEALCREVGRLRLARQTA